jgi:GDP-4-dehydro-6-deoxy-D-mannose reductase
VKALITGVEGFVGRHLATYLTREGYEVWGTTRRTRPGNDWPADLPVQTLRCDVANRADVENAVSVAAPDEIYHLAGISHIPKSWEDPELTFRTNLTGFLHLLDAARTAVPSARILLVSSVDVYGTRPRDAQVREDDPVYPASPYSVARVASEHLALAYHQHYGQAIYVARPGIHTGPGQQLPFALASFARQIALGELPGGSHVLQVGNLRLTRDISDVRDVVQAYRLLLQRGRAGTCYNIGRSEGVLLETAVTQLIAQARVKMSIASDASRVRESENAYLVANTDRIRALGWKPQISLDQTLGDLLQFWRTKVAQGE